MTMRPGETQLWRLANIGADIWYDLQLEGHTFAVIGEDANPVSRVRRAGHLLLPPGKRYDVLVQAPRAGTFTLISRRVQQGRWGDTYPRSLMATLTVAGPAVRRVALPTRLRTRFDDLATAKVDVERRSVFSETKQGNGVYEVDGRVFTPQMVDYAPKLGTVEEWTILNTSREIHPFHIHVNVAAVDGVPHVLRRLAVGLPARDAVAAVPAGVSEPRQRDAVADRDGRVALTELRDDADPFVPGDERHLGLDRPLAAGGVDVGVAQAGCLDPDQDLAGARGGDGHVPNLQGCAQLGNDGCLHDSFSFSWWTGGGSSHSAGRRKSAWAGRSVRDQRRASQQQAASSARLGPASGPRCRSWPVTTTATTPAQSAVNRVMILISAMTASGPAIAPATEQQPAHGCDARQHHHQVEDEHGVRRPTDPSGSGAEPPSAYGISVESQSRAKSAATTTSIHPVPRSRRREPIGRHAGPRSRNTPSTSPAMRSRLDQHVDQEHPIHRDPGQVDRVAVRDVGEQTHPDQVPHRRDLRTADQPDEQTGDPDAAHVLRPGAQDRRVGKVAVGIGSPAGRRPTPPGSPRRPRCSTTG